MTRLDYIRAWAQTNGRVAVYLNGEQITTVEQPSEAFDLGFEIEDSNIEWNRVDLWTTEEAA